MNAITLLTEQHRIVEKLFARYEAASAAEKRKWFDEIADNLAVHTTLEEKVFYPAAYGEDTSEDLEEALQEHLSVKRLIVDLMEAVTDEEAFDAKIKVMNEQVQHHVKEEEEQLFPKIRENLDEETLEALGQRMEKLFAREMKAGPSRKIDEQIDEVPDISGAR